MFSKWFWVIFVVLGLWQWIGTLAERATKKQQGQRVSELTAQRRRQQMAVRPGAGGTAPRATGPVVADRAGELAARRKTQLDELRRRSGTATAQAPTQPATQPPTQPPARARPTPATLRPAAPATRPPAPVPVLAPRRAPAPVRRQPVAKTQPRRAPPPQKRPIPPVERVTERLRRVARTHKTVEVKGPRKLTLPRLDDVPMDRTLLRRMMLYHEILEPPLALREVQSWER